MEVIKCLNCFSHCILALVNIFYLVLPQTCNLEEHVWKTPAISSHLSRPGKAYYCQEWRKLFYQSSNWAGRLPVSQWVKSKKEDAAEFSMVCTTSTGVVGHLTKTSRLLFLGWSYLSRKNTHIFFILHSLSELGGSRRHCWACAMVHPCLPNCVSFAVQTWLRYFLDSWNGSRVKGEKCTSLSGVLRTQDSIKIGGVSLFNKVLTLSNAAASYHWRCWLFRLKAGNFSAERITECKVLHHYQSYFDLIMKPHIFWWMPIIGVLGIAWLYLLKSLFKEPWSVSACFMQMNILDFQATAESVSWIAQQPSPAGSSWALSFSTWFEAIQLCRGWH